MCDHTGLNDSERDKGLDEKELGRWTTNKDEDDIAELTAVDGIPIRRNLTLGCVLGVLRYQNYTNDTRTRR